MIFDTDVLIWVLRGNTKAVKLLDASGEKYLSAISYMELITGCRDKREMRQLRAFTRDLGIEILPVTENISHRAMIYMEEFSLKSNLTLADALIGSTAAETNLPLCTANHKHFRIFSDVTLKVFRP